jgi:diguanylate cyclase (GGDEF)-like protein
MHTGTISLFLLIATALVAGFLLAAVALVALLHERERRRIQRDILALSRLNLITSNFAGGEIHDSLSQTLLRVLSVVRLSAGTIRLVAAGTTEKAAASQGIDDSFARALEEQNVDRELLKLIARLGGLAVFHDLEDDRSWRVFEQDEGFLRFRQIALRHRMRTVIGITLQSKEELHGFLLLASSDSRRFRQGELRLLQTLGHQIGMAIENRHSIQQTARRSEELHMLNEISRTLSSTLDPDRLFQEIFAALQQRFEVSNFYIALYDEAQNQIRFELEIADGVRLAKRSRPAGNHLTEYILRTRKPLLLRHNPAEQAAPLGVQAIQQAGSFCGVPLVAYDRIIGVMAVRGPQEQLYDEGHLEIMRVLANAASIAIENARLFREEQTKARHLTLLNNISRNAIAALSPEEMLSKFAEELERGLAYDHIGIGLLDYATREVTIQAEAGRRRGGLTRRLPFGESLVGRVARTGQMQVVGDFAAGNGDRPVLEGSSSGMAIPIFHGDQIHGVFYIETAEPADFTDEETQVLHTVADLISVALHNCVTLQHAKEEAITDGLTGVKTHRFFIEALSAEWNRATRANRPFSLVLSDLDRFKFVNDFYGHLEGDLVLHRVGQVLQQNCRRSDVVARYGGDEFVILMPETGVEPSFHLAQKLCAAISTDPLLRDKNITASFGIAGFPIHGSTPQELIQVADASMYLAKHQGGDTVLRADHCDPKETKKWKRDVLEAYLGVTLKRLFSSGPEAVEEICDRLNRFAKSLTEPGPENQHSHGHSHSQQAGAPGGLPPALIETVRSLAMAIDSKDHYTQGHSQKVAAYAALMAQALELEEQQIGEIRLAALLHDIGKVGIPEDILSKKGPLNPDEWEKMKEHVAYGKRMLEPLESIAHIRAMVYHHHEMFDGSGYPHGLEGQQIPVGARIIAIADAYDTITSERTYKKARTPAAAFTELQRCAGTQFDPELVRVFIDAVQHHSHQAPEENGIPAPQATP